MKTDSKMPLLKSSQTIDITPAVIFNKRTRTFIMDISEVDAVASEYIILRNTKTQKTCTFQKTGADTDGSGEDIYGWRYRSLNGELKLLLIND